MYPLQTVILRMPINKYTTVEEVEEYFSQFAESFKSQIKEERNPNDSKEEDIEL